MKGRLRRQRRLALDKRARILNESRQLRVENLALQNLGRLKDDFISSVVHELRTPLASIRALAELMADDPQMAPAQRQQFLDIVVAETERLSRLVNQVLDLAKIESGHAEWRIRDVDLRALCEQAALAMAAPLQAQGARLVLDLPVQIPKQMPAQTPTLRPDADRVMQVLLNLLGNAAQHAPQPGGQITLRLRADMDAATVQVQDNGPGVPPDQRDRIFERFQQGGAMGHHPAGTGLGLPISRQIVERFGGRILLRTDTAQGACFEFSLPW